MRKISFKTGQKILKYLASISTPEHAEQIRQRNQEAFDYGGSMICCPHCTMSHDCGSCLWTHAITHITKRSIDEFGNNCPCIYVPFTENDVWGANTGYVPNGIFIATNNLRLTRDTKQEEAWVKAHVDWTNNFKWGTKRVKGYRYSIYNR